MEEMIEEFHELVEEIWNQKNINKEFIAKLKEAAIRKAKLWLADLMQVEEVLRIEFFRDIEKLERVAYEIFKPSEICEIREDMRPLFVFPKFHRSCEGDTEPKRELIDWVEQQAMLMKKNNSKEYSYSEKWKLVSFWYRIASCYEVSRKEPNMKKFYDYILSSYCSSRREDGFDVKRAEQIVKELEPTDYNILKIRATNHLAATIRSEKYKTQEKHTEMLEVSWNISIDTLDMCKKEENISGEEYWRILNNLSLLVADEKIGDVNFVDKEIREFIEKMKQRKAMLEQEMEGELEEEIRQAYERLAYMWSKSTRKDKYEKCYEYFEHYLNMSKEKYGEDSDYIADTYEELAVYCDKAGDKVRALELKEKALEINIREMGKMYLLPPIFKEIVIKVTKMTKGIDERDKFHRIVSVASTYMGLSQSYAGLQELKKAMNCINKAIALLEWISKKKDNHKLVKCHKIKGEIYTNLGKEKSANKEYQVAYDMCHRIMETDYSDFMQEVCQELLEELDKRRNHFMISWLHQEDGVCEGVFKSKYFRDDENGDELYVYAKSPDLTASAQKCVEALNNFTEERIMEICKAIIAYAKEEGIDEEFELPDSDNATEILNYCWFVSMYVNMLDKNDKVAYVMEGEAEWGDAIGFVIEENELIYVGADYFDYMKEEE